MSRLFNILCIALFVFLLIRAFYEIGYKRGCEATEKECKEIVREMIQRKVL